MSKIICLAFAGLFILAATGCIQPKDNPGDPAVLAEREKKLGLVFPSSVVFLESHYDVGLDDRWICKFTIPQSEHDTFFPQGEFDWSDKEIPIGMRTSGESWFRPRNIRHSKNELLPQSRFYMSWSTKIRLPTNPAL